MSDTDSIEETREVLLALIRSKAEGSNNATQVETLARAFALAAGAREKELPGYIFTS